MPAAPFKRSVPQRDGRIELDIQIQDKGPDRFCATIRIKATKDWFATVSYQMQTPGSTAQEWRVRRPVHNTMDQGELIRLVKEYRAVIMLAPPPKKSRIIEPMSDGPRSAGEKNAGIEPILIEPPLPIGRSLPPAARKRLYRENGRLASDGAELWGEFNALVRDFYFKQVRAGVDIRDLGSVLHNAIADLEQDAVLNEDK